MRGGARSKRKSGTATDPTPATSETHPSRSPIMATTIQNATPENPNPEPEDGQLSGRQMSFLEHLEELRQRLLWSVVSLLVGTGICFYFRDDIYAFLARPLVQTLRELHLPDKLIYTNPTDPFNLYIKLSIVRSEEHTSELQSRLHL